MRRRIDTGRSGGIRFSLEPINGGLDKSTNNTDNTVRCSEVNSIKGDTILRVIGSLSLYTRSLSRSNFSDMSHIICGNYIP